MKRRRVIAAAAGFVLAVTPVGTARASYADDVRTVRSALVALPLTPTDRARCVGAPAALLAASNRIGGDRGIEMRAVITSSADIARRVGYDLTRGLNVCLELTENRTFLSGNELPRPYGHVFDGGIIYERYPGQGLRIMPLATFEKADALYRGKQTDEFLTAVDEALLTAAPRGAALQLEYLFPYYGLVPPIRSAMADGTAIMAVVEAYDLTGDPKYLDAGRALFRDVMSLSDSDGDQIWFRHYDAAPWMRVLNSDLRTTYGIGFLAQATGDPSIDDVYERSVRTLLARLPEYDMGTWSRYDQKAVANLNYHDVQTQLLKFLFWQSKDVTFDQWWAKFKAYRAAAPVLKVAGTPPAPVYNVPLDGFADDAAIPFWLSKPGRITLTIRNAAGAVVGGKLYDNVGVGVQTVDWEPPATLGPGTYTVDARAVDVTNMAVSLKGLSTFTIARDTTKPKIEGLGAWRKRLSWRVTDTETPWVNLIIRPRKGKAVHLDHVSLRGVVVLKVKAAGARVEVYDSSGNHAGGVATG